MIHKEIILATHLSVRLAWHDNAWDGCACAAPHLNASCLVHDHIRESRDYKVEREAAGQRLFTRLCI